MYFDLTVLTIPFRILKDKLILFHHILTLPEGSVAKSILEIQQRLHLRGLNDEVSQFLVENEICDVRDFSKTEWRKFVKQKIVTANRAFLIEEAKKYKKIDYLSLACEEFKMKDYFLNLDLNGARIKFRERANCMYTCKRQYSSVESNIRTMFVCESCENGSIDVLSHWKFCESYEQFRQNRNLDADFDLVAFYQDVINYRRAEADH